MYGFTSDAGGNLYLSGNGLVARFTAGTWAVKTLYNGNPQGVALDAAGDLYIADYQVFEGLVEIPVGGTAQTVALGSPGGYQAPSAISIDSAGNIYLTYSYGIYKARSAPSFSYATTIVNQTSPDSPQTLQLQNAGNLPLILSSIAYPTDFPINSSDANLCAAGTSLSLQAQCDISANFTPTTPSPLSESITITDNAPVATSTVAVTGTGSAGGQSQTFAILNRSQLAANICCGTYPTGPTFYVNSTSGLPVTLTVLSGPVT